MIGSADNPEGNLMTAFPVQIAKRIAARLRPGFGLFSRSRDDRKVGFMILGIQKGGKSWLSTTLDHIPELQQSKPKETRFFNARWRAAYDRLSDRRVRSIYLGRHWPNAPARKILFEASPGYLASSRAAQRVARYFPDVKCVVLLRNPVARAFSNYNMWVRNRGFQESFRGLYAPLLAHVDASAKPHQDELDFYHAVSQTENQKVISHGLYYYHFKIWFAVFSRERFFILTTKQLNDKTVYGNLLEFLGSDREQVQHVPFEREPENKHRGAPIDPRDAAELEAFYAPYNARLFQLLGVAGLDW